MPTRRPDRGFTLVELMIVISIIGMLVMLLVPVVSSARMIAAKAATTDVIRRLSMALEAYKSDFGEYPPSRPSWRWSKTADQKLCGTMNRGAANLVWYLAGPGGNGWGVDGAGRMPYDGLNVSGTSRLYTAAFMRPTRSYGPYFKATSDTVAYEDLSGQTVMGAILDGFKPAGKILYFRYEANPEIDPTVTPPALKPNYQVSDNNATLTTEEIGDQDPLYPARKNYYSQPLFLETVRVYLYTSSGSIFQYRYVRNDFLLVSPGPDGFYGWAEKDANGLPIPVTRTKKVAMGYDDITNW
jgi:prepilin-type N-terminal cleavage/methylation domain-containing protein